MALIVADRVVESSTTTGTGAFTLAGAYTGYRAFSAVCAVSDTVYYTIEAVDANGNPSGAWETGLGTYSGANTLTRTSVSASSNANAAVNFAVGTKRVSLNATAAYLSRVAPLSEGGTGAALADPNADRLLFWDDSAGAVAFLDPGTAFSISGTTAGRPSFRGALVKKSADQTGANYSTGAPIPVGWNAEEYDTDNFHDNVTNNTRLTVPSGVSKVRVGFNILLGNVTGNQEVFFTIKKNGTEPFVGIHTGVVDTSATSPRGGGWTAVLSVTPGDYFELTLNSGADTSIDVSASYSWFAIEVVE